MSNKKVSYCNRISKWMDKKELKVMAESLDKSGENWRYEKSRVGKWAIFVEKEDEFVIPHWFMWKWATGRFAH